VEAQVSEKQNLTEQERQLWAAEQRKGRNLWDELIQLRDQQRADVEKSVWLIKGKDLALENNEQGLMQWYMHPLLKGPCINTLQLCVQTIPPGSRSGRIHHPGDQVIFIWEGQGYTTIDGQKHHWSKHDVVQIPLRVNGVTVQHFNTDPDNEARLICCEPNQVHSAYVDRGSGFEQLEVSPDYKPEQ
jgi:mannose-6-phosphate isomerase-like protein (cupin superfamily)